MVKAVDLLQKEIFNSEDRQIIIGNLRTRLLFMVCGLMKTTPHHFLQELNLSTWEMRRRVGIIDSFEYNLIVMMEKGGNCDLCNKPWKKTEIKIFNEGKKKDEIITWYYQPNCTCYQRCIYCHRWLIVETKEHMKSCRYCGVIGCQQVIRPKIKNPNGEWTTRKETKPCTGIMELETIDHGGFTIYECNKCGHVIKRKIVC